MFDQNEYICKECSGGDCPTLKECSEYTDYVSCPTSECEFVVTSDYDDVNDGDDPSGVEGFCVDKVCAGIYDQEECTASKIQRFHRHLCLYQGLTEVLIVVRRAMLPFLGGSLYADVRVYLLFLGWWGSLHSSFSIGSQQRSSDLHVEWWHRECAR